jgi:hypothetical protein
MLPEMRCLSAARVLGGTGSRLARITVVVVFLMVVGTPQATGQVNEPSPAATAPDRSAAPTPPAAGAASSGAAVDAPPAAAIVRFVDLLGGEAAIEQRGDVELTGRQFGPGSQRWLWRAWLRRRPFAVREEFTPADEAGDALGPTAVFVTTEHRAWRLDDLSESVAGETTEADSGVPKTAAREPAPGAALEDSAAIGALDSAFGLRLLLWPADAATRTIAQEPGPVPPAPGLVDDSIAGQLSSTLLIAAPSGRSWLAFFDEGVGVPIALADPFSPDQDWVRFTQWPILESHPFPRRIHIGSAVFHPAGRFIDRVQTGRTHPDALFAGDPQPAWPPLFDAAPMWVVRGAVPGTCTLLLPEVRVDGHGPTPAILDTGASGINLEPELAQKAGLRRISVRGITGHFGTGEADVRWLDSLDIGSAHLLQLNATSVPLPNVCELSRGEQPGLVIGGAALMATAPVLQIRAGRLQFRGPAPADGRARPLAELAGRPTMDLSLTPFEDAPALRSVQVGIGGRHVRALLDTGLPVLLRLSTRGLAALGLAVDVESWRARGALPYVIYGAMQQKGTDWLVQFDVVVLGGGPSEGSVRFEKPWVLLAGLHDAAAQDRSPDAEPWWEAMVGAAAFYSFEAVGLDTTRDRLELLPLDDAVGAAGPAAGRATFVVPDPGRFLGIVLQPGPRSSVQPRDGVLPPLDDLGALPIVSSVIADSAAARAGIRQGDLLSAIDGIPCFYASPAQLLLELWAQPGRSVTLQLVRKAAGTFSVTLPG